MPNFGYEGEGDGYFIIENYITGSVFTCLEHGFAESMTARLYGNSTTVNVRCLLYQHPDLHLIGETEKRALFLAPAWTPYTFNFKGPRPTLFKDMPYCLEAWSSGSIPFASVSMRRVDAGDVDQAHYQILTYDGAPDPLSVTHGNRKFCIYCTYTAYTPATGGGSLYRKPSHFEVDFMRRDCEDVESLVRKRDRI